MMNICLVVFLGEITSNFLTDMPFNNFMFNIFYTLLHITISV
jgi:hypothetical protein